MQKIEITERLKSYQDYDDVYDAHIKNIRQLFIEYDEDFDHILNRKEFFNLLTNLINFIKDDEKEEIFIFTNTKGDSKISYPEFRDKFASIVKMIRIKNLLKQISDII